MKNSKRIIALLVSLATLLPMAACSETTTDETEGTNTPGAVETTGEETVTEETEASAEETTEE